MLAPPGREVTCTPVPPHLGHTLIDDSVSQVVQGGKSGSSVEDGARGSLPREWPDDTFGPVTSDSERIVGLYQRHAAAWDRNRSLGGLYEKAWLDRFIALLSPNASILDLGCGAGVPLSGYLIAQGHAITGVDSSPPLLDLCRQRFPAHEWIHADMRTLDLGRQFKGIVAWDSLFHLTPDDQQRMFPVFGRHAQAGTVLMFTGGPRHGSALGEFEGEPLYHGSLDPEEYATALDQIGFRIVRQVFSDPACGGHAVWLAESG